jgi:hypothetical protein
MSVLCLARKVVRRSLVLAAIGLSGVATATAADPTPRDFAAEPGLQHEIHLAVMTVPASRGSGASPSETHEKLTVVLFFADHARQSHFSGGISAEFSDFDAQKNIGPRKVWAADKCHQNRGIPKLRVIGLYGFIEKNGNRVEVFAEPRRLGRQLPDDEIVETGALADGTDSIGHFKLIKAETKRSELLVEAKLYDFPCRLEPR